MTRWKWRDRAATPEPRTLANFEAHVRNCTTCKASTDPATLCYIGRALHRKVYRLLTK